MHDEYWNKVAKEAEEERSKALRSQMLQRSRLNRAYWSRQWKLIRAAQKKGSASYQKRFSGDLVLCLGRCKGYLPVDRFAVLMSGRVHDKCRACEDRLKTQRKKAVERKTIRECARCGCRIPIGSKLRVCNPCFNGMNYKQRSTVLLGGPIYKLRSSK